MSVAAISRPSLQPRHTLSIASSISAVGAPGHIVVSVTGEVDAANAKEFAAVVTETIAGARHVTLDLSCLNFFALDGVAALHAINARLLRDGVPWRVLPGNAVSRVLALCDPEELIPLVRVEPPSPPRRPRLRLVG